MSDDKLRARKEVLAQMLEQRPMTEMVCAACGKECMTPIENPWEYCLQCETLDRKGKLDLVLSRKHGAELEWKVWCATMALAAIHQASWEAMDMIKEFPDQEAGRMYWWGVADGLTEAKHFIRTAIFGVEKNEIL